MKKITIYSLMVLMTCQLMSQGKNALDLFRGDRLVAKQFYDNMDFRSALHFYEKVLEKKPEDSETKLQMARCYLRLEDPVSALPLLADLATQPDAETEIIQMYANVLNRNGEKELAMQWFRMVLERGYNGEIASKLEFLENIEYYSRASSYEVFNLDLNSDQSDFSYQPFNDGYIFLSARQTERFVQHQPANATNDDEGMLRYFVTSESGPQHLVYDEKLKSYYHDGPLSFYNDHKKVAFTRNNLRDATKVKGISRVNLKIFLADCSDSTTWKNIEPFVFNSDDYSVGHPTLSVDGTIMYFSSDMPGGYGGPDLYYTRLDSAGRWSEPVNLGPEINTSGDELFPHLLNDSIFFFSSSGLGGFGGLDLFTSNIRSGMPGKPQNMGLPLNSDADDFSIIFDPTGRSGYFSSNRNGGQGHDDIYRFETIMYTAAGMVIARQDSSPVSDAYVIIRESNGRQSELRSDSRGLFSMELPYDEKFEITVNKDGYSDLYQLPYSTHDNRINYDTLKLAIWKNELFAKGRLFSNETQDLIQEVTVALTNLENGVKDSVTTGEDGSYHFALAPDSRYRIDASHEGFLENGFEINTKDLFRGELLNDILLEEVFVDKMIVYFDYDDATLNRNYRTDLDKLLRTLKRFPESILNIASHTDARGGEAYNKKLSEDRLKAVIRYFRSRNITSDRIHGIAFGEELLLNQCSDGVVCEETDHSLNRRAEIKVQMTAIH